jgi:dTDP-4-amino-4,6-dideoxygalactose transaminase
VRSPSWSTSVRITLSLDKKLIEVAITDRTKAIVPVQFGKVACQMDRILSIARAHRLIVWKMGPRRTIRFMGSRPWARSAISAATALTRPRMLFRAKGKPGASIGPSGSNGPKSSTTRGPIARNVFRGQVDKYTWVDVGSSYVLSDILGAVLLGQLEARASIQLKRANIWARYASELSGWASSMGVRLPEIPAHCEQAFHMFYLLMPDLSRRTAFIAHLDARGIKAVFHYLPLHLSPMGEQFGGRPGDCPVTEVVSDQLVRLPFYAGLTTDDQSKVVEAVTSFRP